MAATGRPVGRGWQHPANDQSSRPVNLARERHRDVGEIATDWPPNDHATPGGGQASDQANTTAGSGAGSMDGQVPLRAPSAGPISFWVTSLPPAPVSDDASRNRVDPDSQSVLNGHDIPPALPAPSPTVGARSSHRPQTKGQGFTKCSPTAGSDNSMPEGLLLQSH